MDISSLRERAAPGALSVSELNEYIKRLFDSDRTLNAVSVKGEISNFINHRSGHLYFSLKDADGQIRAVMFRSSAQKLKFIPENGMRVVLHGSVSVYQRDGSYQIYANSMEPDGIGALYLAYEQLKEKLFSEGLFSEEHKMPIPEFPERVGVITSPTGAAVRDIINVAGRRFPLAKIYLYPSLVQGDGAADNLVEALDYFEKSKLADVIIIGRGGGSIEDLWAFNSEILARKIFSLTTPIISAVGHETDFTICDFVSDMRAPTPSAAAEIAVPDIREITLRVDAASERLCLALTSVAARKRERLTSLVGREVLRNPFALIDKLHEDLEQAFSEVCDAAIRNFDEKKSVLTLRSEKLNALSPLSVISRGYSITEKSGRVVKCKGDVSVGDLLNVRLSDGALTARVEEFLK